MSNGLRKDNSENSSLSRFPHPLTKGGEGDYSSLVTVTRYSSTPMHLEMDEFDTDREEVIKRAKMPVLRQL
jgi:hypothetical protein